MLSAFLLSILLSILLIISNVILWVRLKHEERWNLIVAKTLDEIIHEDKLKLNSAYGKMVTNLYHDTDSVVDESEEQNV